MNNNKTHNLKINNNNNNDNNKKEYNNNEYNIKLYNSVFNNIYLRGIIFKHLTIYNILCGFRFKSHEQLEQFKYKEYLNNITLEYEHGLSQLPENIKHINIYGVDTDVAINILKLLPNHIESIKLSININSIDIKSKFSTINSTVLSKINSFSIKLIDTDDQIEINQILPSVKSLGIYSQNIIELKKEILPRNLKRIDLINVQSIENGCSLESLSNAVLYDCPTSINNQILSNNLVYFYCGSSDNSNYKIDNSIIFPESLQELTIECYSFTASLPSYLKKLRLLLCKYEDTIIFPSSLQIMYVLVEDRGNKEVFENKESVPCNLKSLEISCSSIVDNNGQSILPDKLEKLTLHDFNKELEVNHLPSSLTSLCTMDSFDQVININVLPSSLKKLELSCDYTQIINPLAIPQQLESIVIKNHSYNHPINLPLSTHPNTLIKCNNLKLYYDPSNTSIRKLRLPNEFNSPLSTLQLQDKSSLEYLHLGYRFNQPIELSDLPIDNNIRTLEISDCFKQTINLEHFQNLETILFKSYPNIPIATTTTTTNQQQIVYNNYNLKNIILSPYKREFLINLDENFYQFIKFVKED